MVHYPVLAVESLAPIPDARIKYESKHQQGFTENRPDGGLAMIIGSINVTGNKLVNKNLILAKLQIEPGDKVSITDIEEGIRTIFGITNFNKVDYELIAQPGTDGYTLTINTLENNPITLKGAVHYDNIFKIGLTANLTLRNILGRSSRALIAGDISENPKLRVNYLKYIGHKQEVAANFTYNYLNEEKPYYEEGLLKDVDVSREHNFALGFLTTQSLKSSLYIGAGYQHYRQKQKPNAFNRN